jgi:hypothetical protein
MAEPEFELIGSSVQAALCHARKPPQDATVNFTGVALRL